MKSSCRTKTLILMLALVVGLSLGLGAALAGDRSPAKRTPGAKAGDCAACHGQAKVLPEKHQATKDRTGEDCAQCHPAKGVDLRAELPLSHRHHLAGVDCSGCHQDPAKAEYLTTAQCLGCHGSAEEVAGLTKDRQPNPHQSVHYGTRLDCDLCHHAHQKSENYCNQCHEYTWMVP